MFEPSGLGASIFSERYTRHPGETYTQAAQRVAAAVAHAEQGSTYARAYSDFEEVLTHGDFMPGGRTMFNAGRPKPQLLNCFVVPTSDSIEAIGKSISDMLTISALGGGVGGNFSPLRGRGYRVGGSDSISTGAVSFMQMWDRTGDVLVSGGGRRLALMLCLNVDHPDVSEFISVKLNRTELNNANVSIVIPPELGADKFVQLVKEGAELPLMFDGRRDELGRTINARELWELIVRNAWESGEPGVLNGDLANRESNVWYEHPLISTNPCGEIWLPAYGCCCLGALVLPRFVDEGRFDFDHFQYAVQTGVRFLDDVLTVNHYPLAEIAEVCQRERRIGLGVMGLHSMLMDMGMRYNEDRAYRFVAKLFRILRDDAYRASVELAREKGPFAAFQAAKYLKGGFAKRLPGDIRAAIAKDGIRNCALLTIAPTGTTSMVQGVTSGIEPLFSPVYIRRRKVIDEFAHETKVETLVLSQDHQDHPDVAQGAYDVSPRDHFRMQTVAQRYIDNAVSKTINLPADYSVEQLSDLWLEYLPQLKGTTFYRQGSRGEEPFEHVPADRVSDSLNAFIEAGKEIEWEGANISDDCPSGVCEI